MLVAIKEKQTKTHQDGEHISLGHIALIHIVTELYQRLLNERQKWYKEDPPSKTDCLHMSREP